jgi:hypothetical protein
LAEAHERGLIHRDVKPANIWLEEGRDRVKIVDFGLALAYNDGNLLPGDNIPADMALARDSDARLTQTNFMVGTPMYMSPEQADAIPDVDHRCDLFSLGGVLYRMATGELPFPGKTTKVVLNALANKTPRAPIELNAELPKALSDLIMRLLSKKRDERPKNARVVVAALAEIREAPSGYEEVEEEPVVEDVVAEVQPEPVRPPRPRHHKGKRDRRRHLSDEESLERKVIKLAIFAGIIVFLLLAALVIKKQFFDRKEVQARPGRRVVAMESNGPATECPDRTGFVVLASTGKKNAELSRLSPYLSRRETDTMPFAPPSRYFALRPCRGGHHALAALPRPPRGTSQGAFSGLGRGPGPGNERFPVAQSDRAALWRY